MTWSQENCLVMNHCLYLRETGKGFYRERILLRPNHALS